MVLSYSSLVQPLFPPVLPLFYVFLHYSSLFVPYSFLFFPYSFLFAPYSSLITLFFLPYSSLILPCFFLIPSSLLPYSSLISPCAFLIPTLFLLISVEFTATARPWSCRYRAINYLRCSWHGGSRSRQCGYPFVPSGSTDRRAVYEPTTGCVGRAYGAVRCNKSFSLRSITCCNNVP